MGINKNMGVISMGNLWDVISTALDPNRRALSDLEAARNWGTMLFRQDLQREYLRLRKRRPTGIKTIDERTARDLIALEKALEYINKESTMGLGPCSCKEN